LDELDGCIQISRKLGRLRKGASKVVKKPVRVSTRKEEMIEGFLVFNFGFLSFVVLFFNIRDKPPFLLVSFSYALLLFHTTLIGWFGDLFCFFLSTDLV